MLSRLLVNTAIMAGSALSTEDVESETVDGNGNTFVRPAGDCSFDSDMQKVSHWYSSKHQGKQLSALVKCAEVFWSRLERLHCQYLWLPRKA
jgi:hypothetical protein